VEDALSILVATANVRRRGGEGRGGDRRPLLNNLSMFSE